MHKEITKQSDPNWMEYSDGLHSKENRLKQDAQILYEKLSHIQPATNYECSNIMHRTLGNMNDVINYMIEKGSIRYNAYDKLVITDVKPEKCLHLIVAKHEDSRIEEY